MSNAVPRQVLGLAVFLNILGVVSVLLGLLLSYMLWRHSRHFSYILALSASTTLGATIGFIRHLDYTLNWRTIKIERYEYSQQPSYTETSIYGNSDVGWRSRMDSVSLYTYYVDALLVMFWAFALTAGTSSTVRVKPETRRNVSITCKVISFALPAIMVGLCSSRTIQDIPAAYLVIYNAIMFVCLTTGFFLVVAVLFKYLRSRHVFSRLFVRSTTVSRSSMRRGSHTLSSATAVRKKTPTDKWLILRFSIIMAILLTMEATQIVYEIVNFRRNRNKARVSEKQPDFSVEQANVDLLQYIPGQVPSILAFSIFGTTAPFRHEYAEFLRKYVLRFCCGATNRKRHSRRNRPRKDPVPWLMLQSRPHPHAECVSFPEDSDALKVWREQEDPEAAAKIQIKTEILTSITSADSTTTNSPDAITPTVPKEFVSSRRTSFGGTSIASPFQVDPTEPCVALQSPHWKGRPIVTDFGGRDGSVRSFNGQGVETWAWLSLSREPSIASLTSLERPSWSAPTTPVLPQRMALAPMVDEVDDEVEAPERVLISSRVRGYVGR